ncbi:hypothetical protein [Amycolatopsis sp. cmx-4-61]|uniref:hypothetical protein n=1 Tax=Amycolatopsis sp. cmx-4-61 TaxID=2790937 RepID=UPI00397C60AE
MPKALRYLAAWSASTAVAVALSWLGIRFVLDAGAPDRPRLVAAPTQQPTVVATTISAPATTITTTPPPTVDVTTSSPAATTKPASTAQAQPPGNGTWSTQNGERVYTRSVSLQGGVATVRFTTSGVDPISATPRPGFAAGFQRPAAKTLVVDFTSSGHRSRLEASWVSGPQWRVIECG